MMSFLNLYSKYSYLNKCLKLSFVFVFSSIYFISPAYSAKWIQIDEGSDSGDTYLWPYFHKASRFIDIESIYKKDGFILYRELVNAQKAISPNVLSLIVEKKSYCDGQKVLWQHFSIYKLHMGKGKAIMSLNPNESQTLTKGSAGYLSDNFVCNFKHPNDTL